MTGTEFMDKRLSLTTEQITAVSAFREAYEKLEKLNIKAISDGDFTLYFMNVNQVDYVSFPEDRCDEYVEIELGDLPNMYFGPMSLGGDGHSVQVLFK